MPNDFNRTQKLLKQLLRKQKADLEAACNILAKKLEELYQDSWNTMLMHVRNQLNQLDGILQMIFKNVNEKSTIVNKDDVKIEIKDLRNTLTEIRKELASAQANPEISFSILQVNKVIIGYLQDAQKHKFREWKMIDLAEALVRSGQEPLPESLDEMFAQIMITNQALKQLEKEAEKIDLTLVNRTARFVGDNIVDPVLRHDLITWALAGGASIGLATYIMYYFDNTFFAKEDSWFRKLFGFPDHTRSKMISLLPDHIFAAMTKRANLDPATISKEELQDIAASLTMGDKRKAAVIAGLLANQANRDAQPGLLPIAKLDEFLSDNRTGSAAIGITLFALATYEYHQILKRHCHEWAKKMYVWFEKLKGGSYAKNAEKYDEILGSSITFDDIIGMEYEKQLVYPHLKYIKDPEVWDSNDQTPPTGIILTGPTRTGKTFFAKAICGELHKQNPDKTIRFVAINAHDIKEMGIERIMLMAKLWAPCVLFIDEIDLLGFSGIKIKSFLLISCKR